MPIYEYEPDGRDCLMCDGRVAVIQGIEEPNLEYCPDCGMGICRVVSRAAFKIGKGNAAERAGKGGFTTWKRAGEGKWEKVSGPGVDAIEGRPEDIEAVKAEKRAAKVIDLDVQ